MSEHGVLFSGERARGVPAQERIPAVGWRRTRHVLGSLPVAPPSQARGALHRAAVVLVAVGLVAVSWDRLLNVQVASYNIKLPSLAFSAAAVLALLATRHPVRVLLRTRLRGLVLALVGVIVLYELVRGAFSAAPTAAVAQVAAVLTGAVLPAVALLLVLRDRADLRWALSWLLTGAVAASVFGVYQLTAFYLGWPQGIAYNGVGIGTGIGRISAFNYEPAYFAYFLVLALGAAVALRRLDGKDAGWPVLIVFGVMLYLANVRAAPLVAAAFGVLLLVAFARNRRLVARGAVVLVVTVVVALATPSAVAAVGGLIESSRAAQPSPTAPADDEPTSTPTAPTPTPTDTADAAGQGLRSQLRSVDPNEQSSNAPRLGLYRAVLHEVAATPMFGLGAGGLGAALQRNAPGAIQDQIGGQVVANNIWLQALADGGVVQLLLELALVVVVAVAAVRRRASDVYPMAAALLAVIAVGGMLTSYFFDIKVWVVLALVLVGFGLTTPHEQPQDVEATA